MIRWLVRFFNTDGLLKDSSIFFVGLSLAQAINLGFQMMMGRLLSASEFALLVSLISLFSLLTFPLGVVSTAINRYTRLLVLQEREGDAHQLLSRWFFRLLSLALICSAVVFLFASKVAGFLHLNRMAPVYIFALILPGVFCSPVSNGALLGLQRFKTWSAGVVLGSLVRLLFGVLLVAFVSPFAGWGLLGHGCGFYAMLSLGLTSIFFYLRGLSSSSQPLPSLDKYLFSSFFIMLGFAVLMSGDMILIKHLMPEEAGTFSYASILGHLVLFLPQSLVSSMFPKVVADGSVSREKRNLLFKTLLAVFLSASATALFLSLTAQILPCWIFGIKHPNPLLAVWLRELSWAMVPVALLSVIMRYALAQHRLRAAFLIPSSALIYLAVSLIYSRSPDHLLLALLVATLLAVFGLIFLILKEKPLSKLD